MSNGQNLIGVNVSSKEPGLEDKVRKLIGMGVSWFQLYIEPDTPTSHIQFLKRYPINIIVHVAHEYHGFNFASGVTKLNKRLIDETVSAADGLDAKFIVLHPSYLTQEQWNCGLEEDLHISKTFDGLVDYIARQAGKKNKVVLAENMPKWDKQRQYLFHHPVDSFYGEMERAGFGFCLDLASVAVTTNSYPYFVFNPPPERFNNEIYAREMLSGDGLGNGRLAAEHALERELRHRIAVEEFMHLNPQLVHVRGVGHWDFVRLPKEMTDLNELQLRIAIPYCKSHGVPMIIEGPKHQQASDVAYIKKQFKRFS
ncbi:MAG TPA: hypothetical protein VJJ52_02095 [Candidatus Nanoarchaeia archaeon]|nr:hypothetical protein [Candidatus Nanoarchaeia archaeon]